MGTLSIDDHHLRLHFSRVEKVVGALTRDLDVPLSSVTSAERVDEGWARAVHGLRVGLGMPGYRLLGTWRKPGLRQLVDLRRAEPFLRIRLRDERYDEVLLSTPDADLVLDRLRREGVGAG